MGSSSREIILKKIRQALSESTPQPFPQSEGSNAVYHPQQKELEFQFAEEFSKLQGRFAFCLHTADLCAQLAALIAEKKWTSLFCNDPAIRQLLAATLPLAHYSTDLAACDASITGCENLVARTGSILLSSANPAGRTVSVYAPVHICIAFTRQLLYDVKDALQLVKERYPDMPSLFSFASGPSRTADIEKTLVTGVHGPKEVYVFLVDKEP